VPLNNSTNSIIYYHHTTSQAPQSSLAAKPTIIKWGGNAVISHTTRPRVFDRKAFVQIQQAWAVIDPLFDTLLDAYKKAIKKVRSSKKPTLKEWTITRRVSQNWPAADYAAMSNMKNMSRKCKMPRCVLSHPLPYALYFIQCSDLINTIE
jgi:hypothetical protein